MSRRVPDVSFEVIVALILFSIGAFIAAPIWAIISWARR